MEDSLDCGLFSDHITSHRQTWNIRKRCFQRVSESKWNGTKTAINKRKIWKKYCHGSW